MLPTVLRTLRESNRYTGDGLPNEPVGHPLPVGDPASGVYNPSKKDLRDALTETVTEAESLAAAAAAGSVDAAADSAYQAGLYAAEAAGVTSDITKNIAHIGQSGAQGSAGALSAYWPDDPRIKTAVLGSGLVATSGLQSLAPFNADGSLNPGAVMAEELAKAKGWSVNVFPSYQGATAISAWAGSDGLVIFEVNFDGGGGAGLTLADTLTWNSGLDGPAYVLSYTDSGATGSMVLAMSVGKRMFDNTAFVASGGKTGVINGDPVEKPYWDATHVLRVDGSTGGNLVPGDTLTWTGGAAVVRYATYQSVATGRIVVRLTSGTYPVTSTALTGTGGKAANTANIPYRFNLRWTVTCAYDGGNVAALTTGAGVTWTVGGVSSAGFVTDATNGTTGNVWIEVTRGLNPVNDTVLTCGAKTMTVNGALTRGNRPKWDELQDQIAENALAQFDALAINHGEAGYDWTDAEYTEAMDFIYERAKRLGRAPDMERFMPFILAMPYVGPKQSQQAYRAETIQAYGRNNSGWAKAISTFKLSGRDDTPGPTGIINHLDNKGLEEIGKRMARGLLGLLSGDASETDMAIEDLRLPGAVNKPGALGHRLYEPDTTISANTTLLIDNKAYLGQLYALSGTITVTLDGDANKALGDGGAGFAFYTSLAGDTITFDGDGRSCMVIGVGTLSPTVTISGAGFGTVFYRGTHWAVQFFPNADVFGSKYRTAPNNTTDGNVTLIVTNGGKVRLTGSRAANRIVSLSQIGASSGDVFTIINETTGGFNTTVRDNVATGNSKVTTAGNRVDFQHNGTAWEIAGYIPL